MENKSIQEHFKKQIDDYTGLMQRIIPEYLLQNEIMIELIPFKKKDKIKVLDLGAGNGIVSTYLLKKFEEAELVVFDLTKEMLDICKINFSSFKNKISYINGDYFEDDIGDKYDVVITGLTLHHFTPEQRRKMYEKIYRSLKPFGIYISRDIIIDDRENIKKLHYKLWKDFMNNNGEDAEFWYKKHKEKDYPVSLNWLENTLLANNFIDFVCHWKHYNFCITTCLKSK